MNKKNRQIQLHRIQLKWGDDANGMNDNQDSKYKLQEKRKENKKHQGNKKSYPLRRKTINGEMETFI